MIRRGELHTNFGLSRQALAFAGSGKTFGRQKQDEAKRFREVG